MTVRECRQIGYSPKLPTVRCCERQQSEENEKAYAKRASDWLPMPSVGE
ncbi:hypothetical protein BIFDEN_00480 [Bifidobacterium dentium ATCC 27678]|nr:hypothetical protein BIFDEN_00480 [Bifidobacterium dentium ATCC 27678]